MFRLMVVLVHYGIVSATLALTLVLKYLFRRYTHTQKHRQHTHSFVLISHACMSVDGVSFTPSSRTEFFVNEMAKCRVSWRWHTASAILPSPCHPNPDAAPRRPCRNRTTNSPKAPDGFFSRENDVK